jgi:hypothetical protein
VRPSYTNRAESLLLAVSFPDNPQHSHVIGSFVRGSVSTDLKYSSDGNLMFLDWVPRLPVLRSRDVTLTARSPNSGSDESVGTSGRFLLELSFQFAATAWGNCIPDGKGAAIDVQRRYDVLHGVTAILLLLASVMRTRVLLPQRLLRRPSSTQPFFRSNWCPKHHCDLDGCVVGMPFVCCMYQLEVRTATSL